MKENASPCPAKQSRHDQGPDDRTQCKIFPRRKYHVLIISALANAGMDLSCPYPALKKRSSEGSLLHAVATRNGRVNV